MTFKTRSCCLRATKSGGFERACNISVKFDLQNASILNKASYSGIFLSQLLPFVFCLLFFTIENISLIRHVIVWRGRQTVKSSKQQRKLVPAVYFP